MTHVELVSPLIGEFLGLDFSQPLPIPIVTTGIGADQPARRLRVPGAFLLIAPGADCFDGIVVHTFSI